MTHLPAFERGTVKCSCGKLNFYSSIYAADRQREAATEARRAFRAHVIAAQAEERASAERERDRVRTVAQWEARQAALHKAKNQPAAKTARRWKRLTHRAWDWKRTLWIGGDLERAFADEWEWENVRRSYLNQGQGTLQNLFFRAVGSGIFRRNVLVVEIDNRDAMIAATVVQWLGTNIGLGFLRKVLQKCGYEISDRPREQPDDWKPKHVAIHVSAQEVAVLRAFQRSMNEKTPAQLVNQSGLPHRQCSQVFEVLCKLGFCQWSQRGVKDAKDAAKYRLCSLTKLGRKVCEHWDLKEYKDGGGAELRCHIPQGHLRDLQRSYSEIVPTYKQNTVPMADVPRPYFALRLP